MRRFVFAVALLVASPLAAQFAHTRGQQILAGENQVLQVRGTNLGNWFLPEGYMWHFDNGPQSPREIEAFVTEAIGPTRAAGFWRDYHARYITREDFHWIRQAGFNTVRLPIDYRLFAGNNAEGWQMLDRAVSWARAEGLYLVIDLHAAPGGQTGANIDDSFGWPWLLQDEGAQHDTIELWKRIAARYSQEAAILGYDLLNEPLPHFPQVRFLDARLEPFYRKLIAAIRQVDKNHIVILEAARWDSDFSVFGKPFDSNVVYEFHYYAFGNPVPPTQAAIQQYLDFRDKHNVPLWLGESGENVDAWIAATRALMEANQIGWTFWPYKKMDAKSSPVTFAPPENWGRVVEFAKGDRGLGNIEERWKRRPPQEVLDRAFDQLLENIGFDREQYNAGYIHALLPGARVP